MSARKKTRGRASGVSTPVRGMIAENSLVVWAEEHRSLVPKTFTEDRHERGRLDQSIGDLILLGLGHNAQSNLGSGALSAIANRLDVLYRALPSDVGDAFRAEIWSIMCHARAVSHLVHRMLDEEAPKKRAVEQ